MSMLRPNVLHGDYSEQNYIVYLTSAKKVDIILSLQHIHTHTRK